MLEADPGPEARLELVELAIAGDPRFEASRAEIDRPGPSYTVDTLAALVAESPDDELTFIVGGDMAYAFPQWRRPFRLLPSDRPLPRRRGWRCRW